jgi:purine-binding chemotaxis protein CheW
MIFPIAAGRTGSVEAEPEGYVTFRLDGQWLGVPVVRVQEVLTAQAICPVPLAPAEVAGFINLRGQIVTVVDLRCRLGLPGCADRSAGMNIVLRDGDELFSFLVDGVGDVVEADSGQLEPAPPTLNPRWMSCCDGVIRLHSGLLVVMSIDLLLDAGASAPA